MKGLPRLARGAAILLALGSVAAAAAPVIWHWAGESEILPAPSDMAARSTAPVVPAAPDTVPIVALAPFGSLPQPEAAPEAVAETTLDLTLRGIVQARDPARSQAVISSPEATLSYVPGETIGGQAVLLSVAADHVILEIDGKKQALGFPDGDTPTLAPAAEEEESLSPFDKLAALAQRQREAGPPAAEAAPQTTDDYIQLWRKRIQQNPAQVLDDIGLIASDEGYVIAEQHDSGVRLAGLRPGDLVARVNGQQVGNVEKDVSFFDDVAASDQARLEIVRDGETIVLSFPLR